MSARGILQGKVRYPLANALKTSFGWHSTRENLKLRAQVVNPQLCDDILNHIAPTLERHKGCDIIDINPGAGLWSSKIHDFLKPRHHLLLEPLTARDGFMSLLEPLLKDKNSHYLYSEYDTGLGQYIEDVCSHVVQKKLLPKQDRLTNGKHDPSNRNDSLLVLFSPSKNFYDRSKYSHGFGQTSQFVYQFLEQQRLQQGLHANGPVRLLAWADDVERYAIMPRTVALRWLQAVQGEQLSDTIELASANTTNYKVRRPAIQEAQSSLDTALRMIQTGISMPERRMSLIHREALKNFTTSDPAEGMLASLLSELGALEKSYGRGDFPKSKIINPQSWKRIWKPTREFLRMTELQGKLEKLLAAGNSLKPQDQLYTLFSLYEELRNLERGLEHPRIQNMRPSLDTNIDQCRSAFREAYGTTRYKSRFDPDADNYEALHRPDPLLVWDRRPHEPLTVQPDEFWPNTPLALYDIQPRESTNATTFDPFIRSVMKRHALPIEHALNALGPGTAEALIPQCPSLRDLTKGGRASLADLRVRMLTLEMLAELLDAWNKSPLLDLDTPLANLRGHMH